MLTLKKGEKDPLIFFFNNYIYIGIYFFLTEYYINQPKRSKHIIIYWGHASCFFSWINEWPNSRLRVKTYPACGAWSSAVRWGRPCFQFLLFLLFPGLGPPGGKNKVIWATFSPAWEKPPAAYPCAKKHWGFFQINKLFFFFNYPMEYIFYPNHCGSCKYGY